jgi:MFS transporter, CP family, cyanate transporter
MTQPDQRRSAWFMLMLLWLLYIAFGMVARAIFPLVTPIISDLKFSYSQMGMILGSWQLTYILAALVAGSILDRWGIRKAIFAGALIIALSSALRYFANSFLFMLAAVALFGAGGPMISIGGPKTISEWFEGKSRATAVGIYTTGPWVGGLLALSLTNSMVMPMVDYSWRMTFVCYGILTLFLGFLWLIFARGITVSSPSEGVSITDVFRYLIRIKTVRILLLMSLFSFAVGHGFSGWLPRILEGKGFSASAAGFGAALPLAAGIPAVLLFPRLTPQGFRGRVIGGCALITILNLIVVMNAGGLLLYAALMVYGFFASPFMPLMLLMLMDSPEMESRYMGAAGGMFFCVAEIGGFLGPLVMGLLVDMTGTFMSGALFLAGLCIAMFGMALFLRKKDIC